MKIGFWNRLAIVAAGIAVLVVPVIVMESNSRLASDSAELGYKLCVRDATEPRSAERCQQEKMAELRASGDAYNLETWFRAASATLFLCALVYTLVWLSLAAVRWVWRGRDIEIGAVAKSR